MADGADHREQPELFQRDARIEQGANGVAEESAAEAEKQHQHLSGKDATEKNAHQQHHQRIASTVEIERDEGDDVCQSEFYARNGDKWRDLRFDEKKNERNGGEQRQLRQACGVRMWRVHGAFLAIRRRRRRRSHLRKR